MDSTNILRDIAHDKVLFFQRNCIYIFLDKKICCGYSLEAPWRGNLMSTHNICFHWEIGKLFTCTWYPLLSRPMMGLAWFQQMHLSRGCNFNKQQENGKIQTAAFLSKITFSAWNFCTCTCCLIVLNIGSFMKISWTVWHDLVTETATSWAQRAIGQNIYKQEL